MNESTKSNGIRSAEMREMELAIGCGQAKSSMKGTRVSRAFNAGSAHQLGNGNGDEEE